MPPRARIVDGQIVYNYEHNQSLWEEKVAGGNAASEDSPGSAERDSAASERSSSRSRFLRGLLALTCKSLRLPIHATN